MKKSLLLSLLLCFSSLLSANSAMPGFWSTGGSHTFIPFFASDSIYIGDIQMESEEIHIQLYKGYAVVRGDYWMRNLTDSSITLHTGYPINGMVRNREITSVHFSDLYGLRVVVDSVELESQKLESFQDVNQEMGSYLVDIENWYVWNTVFDPDSLTHITVYFLVNTNAASLREGYNVEKDCGFSYILESGKAWAKKITNGRIRMELMDGLSEEDVIGILPGLRFSSNGTGKFIYEFKELEPETVDNIVVRYFERNDDFFFEEVEENTVELFDRLDQMESEDWNTSGFTSFTQADFHVANTFGNVMLGIFILIGILVVAGIGSIIWLIRRAIVGKRRI